jgi:hypothetical protein
MGPTVVATAAPDSMAITTKASLGTWPRVEVETVAPASMEITMKANLAM